MARVYYRWTPARRGLTGWEYLAQYLDENFPGVSYTEVISDGLNHYGYVEGTGDEFRKALRAIETKFSAQKVDEDVIIGAVRALYSPPAEGEFEGMTPPTWDEICANHGLTVDTTKELDYVKAYKIALLKEQARADFPEWNDSLADVAKALFAKLIWYDECTLDEQSAIDNAIANIKTMYTKDMCIKACNTLAQNLTRLSGYYSAKMAVLAATTIDEVLAVDITG